MVNSIRFRLALWFTAILALVLTAFAITAYLFLSFTIAQQTDRTLRELSHTFIELIESEGNDKEDVMPKSEAIRTAVHEAMSDLQYRNYQILIFDAQNTPLSVGTAGRNRPNIAAEQITSMLSSFATTALETDLRDLATDTDKFRIFLEKEKLGEETFTIVVAHSLREETELSRIFLITLAISIPLALLLACFGGYFLARKSLSPVAVMTESASQIGATNLHERLPVRNAKDELGGLAIVINSLLERLENSFEIQRRFMADASHELRTPVAIMQGESEVALLKGDRPVDEYKESLSIVHDESKRLTKIVENLFTLARADSGQLQTHFEPLYLEEVVGDAVRSVRTLAKENEINFSFKATTTMPFKGDVSQLHRLFLNLLDNAVKYSSSGDVVVVACDEVDGRYVISVSDKGPGIPPSAIEKVFDRFFRVDDARGRSNSAISTGAGLGLSIAKWISEIHEGEIRVLSTFGSGSVFLVEFPKPK
jgi:heavy metal sensor kinase